MLKGEEDGIEYGDNPSKVGDNALPREFGAIAPMEVEDELKKSGILDCIKLLTLGP